MPKVKVLDQKRPDYHLGTWIDYELLYRGGHAIEAQKARFIGKKPAETPDWYGLRLGSFTYKNAVATIVDDLVAMVFQSPLEMSREKGDAETRPEADSFYAEFWADPTGEGEKDWSDYVGDRLTWAMVQREAWTMICFPENPVPGFEPTNRLEQEQSGALRAMLRPISATAVTNVTRDASGISEVMLRHRVRSDSMLVKSETPKDKIVWTHFTRRTFQQFEIEVERGKEPQGDEEARALEQPQSHRLAGWANGRGHVPVVPLCFDDRLWAVDKLALLAKEELRKRNGLAWYEELACYPQPYHKGESTIDQGREEKGGEGRQARGAQMWLELDPEGEAGYMEPSGASLSHLKDRLDQVERDIYKAVQNLAAAQGPSAAAQVQSAASKARDAVAKEILCEAYAKPARGHARLLANLVSFARSDADHRWEVGGLDQFDIPDEDGTIDTALKLQALPELKQVRTFYLGFLHRIVRVLSRGASTEELDRMESEVKAIQIEIPTADEEEEA